MTEEDFSTQNFTAQNQNLDEFELQNQENQSLASNEKEISVLKNLVNESIYPAFLCTTIKKENPNYLAIIHSNQTFCQAFEQNQNDAIGKSYDFLFDDIDVSYSSENQLEYIRIIKAVKNREECSVVLKIDNHIEEERQISKFKIDFKPIVKEVLQKFYGIFYFQKINQTSTENEEINSKKENIKTQNQSLIKNLERSLNNEKLLREISYLIISDKSVKEIAQNIAKSLAQLLKIDRCVIHDLKDGKPNFIVEYCPLKNNRISDNNYDLLEKYVDFQNKFCLKLKEKTNNEKAKNSLFIANDTKKDSSFEEMHEFFNKFAINSQISAITLFDDKMNGGIYLHSSQNIDLKVDEIELIEIIADQLAIAIDRSDSIEKVMIANHNLITKTLELKEAVKKEKEMRKLQTEFVALVSHEFKTPLQIIDSTRELIARKIKSLNIEDESFLKYVERIKSAIQRMSGLINSTLDLAKIDIGKSDIEVKREEFDLHNLIKDITEKALDLALKQNIKISLILCNESSIIYADPKLLDHCFTNIISNAIKYSKQNSEVKIITKCNDEKIAIRIIDQGIGIPKDDLKKIGNKFFRAKNTLAVSGTGIGIYLTKYFIELHNGVVRIESEIDVGTSFTVILPKK